MEGYIPYLKSDILADQYRLTSNGAFVVAEYKIEENRLTKFTLRSFPSERDLLIWLSEVARDFLFDDVGNSWVQITDHPEGLVHNKTRLVYKLFSPSIYKNSKEIMGVL